MKKLFLFVMVAGCTDGQIGLIKDLINPAKNSPQQESPNPNAKTINVNGFVYSSVNGEKFGVDGIEIRANNQDNSYSYKTYTKGIYTPNFTLPSVPIGSNLRVVAILQGQGTSRSVVKQIKVGEYAFADLSVDQ